MMKMNWGIWIGIIGGAIGMAVGVASVFVTAGSDAPWIAGIMLTVFGGMAFLFYKLIFGPMFNNARLQKHGISGKARILEVRDTGITVNNNPQVKLMLEIKNTFGQTYQTTCRVLVSRVNPGAYRPGMEVPVKIDPKNEKNVVLDFSGSPTSGATGVVTTPVADHQLKDELETLQQRHESIMLSGVPARAIIKTYTWLGVYVNGNNPFAELEVEVLPENAPAFGALIRAVFGEQGLYKYQPGKEIRVKYDRYDNSKVTVDQ